MIPKFRAFDKKTSKIYEVGLLDYYHDVAWLDDVIEDECVTVATRKLTEIELMQSTGLFDKNGTEIFEGDLLSWNGEMPHIVKFGQWICEDDLGYKIRNIGFYLDSSYDNTEWLQGIDYEITPTKFEIIGNIWDGGDLIDN